MYPTIRIPGTAGVTSVCRLHDNGIWQRGGLTVVDLAPGAEHPYQSDRTSLAHMCEGEIGLLHAGDYIALEAGYHILRNESTTPSRIVLMELFGGALIPRSFNVMTTRFQKRPLGIKLKPFVPKVIERPLVGYEYVELPADCTVPRHIHTNSSAIALILRGSGYAGRYVDGLDVVEKVGPGSVVYFPARMEHGFHTKEGLVLVSAQDPDISRDYLGVTERAFDYSKE